MPDSLPPIHIRRAGPGRQPTLCGARPAILLHARRELATCQRCLAAMRMRGDFAPRAPPEKKQMTETTVQGKGAALPPEQEVRSGAKPEKVFTRSL